MRPTRAVFGTLFALALLLGLAGLARAGDYEDGHAAYMHGDVETALRLWTPIAEQGNAEAQYMLGLIYHNGRAVPKDESEATKWLNLAAKQGNDDARYLLDLINPPADGMSMGSNK
jgi:TPR repeat protein